MVTRLESRLLEFVKNPTTWPCILKAVLRMNERQIEKKRREKSREKHRKKVGEKTYKRGELEKGKIEHEIYMALTGLRSTVLMIIEYFDIKGLIFFCLNFY